MTSCLVPEAVRCGLPLGGRSPRRVAVLSPAAELGGAERSLLTFLQACNRSELEPFVILPRSAALGEMLTSAGVGWRVVPQPTALLRQSRWPRAGSAALATLLPFAVPRYLSRLAGAVRQQAPDVLYSNGVKAHILASVIGTWLRVPSVWHVRDFLGGTLMSWLADRVPVKILANSEAVASCLARRMRRPEKISVVYNAVDLDLFSPRGGLSEEALRYPAEYRVGLAAVLARWKGHFLLLDAVKLVCKRFPETVFFFVGGSIYDTTSEDGYENELRQEVARRGLAGKVVLTGFQRNMPPWYRAMDVVVHASTRPEPFGRTVMEAMACGRPVVAADSGGIPEYVTQEVNGLLYRMGDADALAQCIARLLGNARQRERLGVAARRAAVERFAPRDHAARISSVLLASAAHSQPPRWHGLAGVFQRPATRRENTAH